MQSTQTLLQNHLMPYQPMEESSPLQEKYALIPSEERLDAFAITKQEFEAIVNYVDNMDPISKNTIIKKCDSGLAFTIGCVPDVNTVSINILFKKKRLFPQGSGGSCSATIGWNVFDKEITFRSAKAEHISPEEREINCVLYPRRDRFVVGKEFFDYRGPCKRGRPTVWGYGQNEKGEFMPCRREKPLPPTDKDNDTRPIFDKTGVILETMHGSVPLFKKKLTPDNIFHIAREVLKSLIVLHEEFKIVHMDIKPDNIFLKGETVKIADFGHAKYLGKPINHQFTYHCKSPEIIELGKNGLLEECKADFPMDMWSFGGAVVNMMCLAVDYSIWTLSWDIVCRKMHSTRDTYDFNELIKGFLAKLRNEIEENGNLEYLKIFPLLEKCLQIDPKQRMTAREAIELIEELG